MRNLGGSVREFKKGMDDPHKDQAPPPSNAAPAGAVSREALPPPSAPSAPPAAPAAPGAGTPPPAPH